MLQHATRAFVRVLLAVARVYEVALTVNRDASEKDLLKSDEREMHYANNAIPPMPTGYWPKTPTPSCQDSVMLRPGVAYGSEPQVTREPVRTEGGRAISADTRTDVATVVESKEKRRTPSALRVGRLATHSGSGR